MSFIRPINPGVHLIVQAEATDVQIAYTKREHKERIHEYHLFNATDAALKLQLTKDVDKTYIQGIRDHITGYATQTTRDIIKYLYRTYSNNQNFKAPYDGSRDLEIYFNRLEDCLHMAEAAGQPYSKSQTLTTATVAISQYQLFPLAMQEWHRLDEPRRTWAAFKTTLLDEQKSEQENGFAPTSAYVNNVNGSHETAKVLNHIAQATAADRQAAANQAESVANLTMSNQNLEQHLQ